MKLALDSDGGLNDGESPCAAGVLRHLELRARKLRRGRQQGNVACERWRVHKSFCETKRTHLSALAIGTQRGDKAAFSPQSDVANGHADPAPTSNRNVGVGHCVEIAAVEVRDNDEQACDIELRGANAAMVRGVDKERPRADGDIARRVEHPQAYSLQDH